MTAFSSNQNSAQNEIFITSLDYFDTNNRLAFSHQDRDYLAIKEESEFFIVENSCPHANRSLEEGDIAKGQITCPFHGWTFKLSSGECLNIKNVNLLKTYRYRIKDNAIYLVS